MPELSELLVRRRKDLHLTQEEACKKLGISRASLANYECGKFKPKAQNARRISEVYGIPLETIIRSDDLDDEDSTSSNMQVLFNELKGASEEDIQKVIEIARVIRRSSGGREW